MTLISNTFKACVLNQLMSTRPEHQLQINEGLVKFYTPKTCNFSMALNVVMKRHSLEIIS